LALCFLGGCTTIRSYTGYVVTKTKNVELPGNGAYAKQVTKATSGCFDEFCDVVEVTLLYHGHTIKAHCQLFDPLNRCGELQVGARYNFTRDKSGEDFLFLDDPRMTLAVEEEHN
jgi:hypothetical protein